MSIRRFVMPLFVVGCVSIAAPARGQTPADTRARQHFDSATAYFEVGEYESALREFRASFDESGRIELQYNIYLCAERLGRFDEAADALAMYLDGADPENEATLRARLENLRERSSTGATAPPAPVSTFDPTLAFVGFSVAGAGLIGAAIFGGLTLAEDGRLDGCAPRCTAEDTGTISWSAPVTDVSFGIAAAGAVLGVVGLFVGQSATPAPEAASVSIGPGNVSVRGTF